MNCWTATKTRFLLASILTIAVVTTAMVYRPQGASSDYLYQADPQLVIGEIPLTFQSGGDLVDISSEPQLAINAATNAYDAFVQSGNSRYLDIAQQYLSPWWGHKSPPADAWYLRARILQARHQFQVAAEDLSQLLDSHPRHVAARLLAADSWRRAGNLQRARQSCLALGLAGLTTHAALCAAEVTLSAGDTGRAAALVKPIKSRLTVLNRDERVWATAVIAEVYVANGDSASAVPIWEYLPYWQTLPLGYKLALADLLISQQRYSESQHLLENERPGFAVLLRRAVVAEQLSHEHRDAILEQLQKQQQIVAVSEERKLHLYELALYALWVENDSQQALQLALENWSTQRSYEDAALVLSAAESANDAAAKAIIEQWQRNWQAALLADISVGNAAFNDRDLIYHDEQNPQIRQLTPGYQDFML